MDPSKKLQKLLQVPWGELYFDNGPKINLEDRIPPLNSRQIDRIKTLVVRNPCLEIGAVIDEMVQQGSAFIPKSANAYVVSDFNGDTQQVRKDEEGREHMFSVYAVQFYYVSPGYRNI